MIYIRYSTGRCICSAYGNAFIKTYDGQSIYHNGGCTYTLTKSTRFPDPCAFNVEVMMLGNAPGSSTVQAVIIHMYHLKIQLGPGYDVYVSLDSFIASHWKLLFKVEILNR